MLGGVRGLLGLLRFASGFIRAPACRPVARRRYASGGYSPNEGYALDLVLALRALAIPEVEARYHATPAL